MILAGDIGGTKTYLALFDENLRLREGRTYPSRNFGGLDEIVRQFVSETGQKFSAACFGIAGPVRDDQSKTTNLPWVVDARRLAEELVLPRVGLINDLEANAYGIAALGPNDFAFLCKGASEAEGNTALVSAGTGLGEAGLYWDGERHRPFASEGGHSSFSPRDELELELWRFLHQRFGPVSWERVLSGPGLKNLYDFFRKTRGGKEPPWLVEQMRKGDPSAAISRAALSESCPVCVEAVERFVSLYGAEAGNAALKFLATGGVYLGGGIAPKILEKLQEPGFREGFLDKGRMRPLLETIPVRVILNPKTALTGAARFASLNRNRPGGVSGT